MESNNGISQNNRHLPRQTAPRTQEYQDTEIYINLEQAVFNSVNDEFHVKTAERPEEIKALLEVGFEYVCEKDGLAFFRKRK